MTSDKCYENHDADQAFRETDAMGGRDPYSASKGCAELVTAAYRASYFADGAAVASVRAGNVIGGGDWAVDRIIPDCVRALVAGEPVVVRNPDAVRPWQHVLEPLSGYLRLGALMLDGGHRYDGPWNFGPTDQGGDRPVSWVVDRFLGRVGLRLLDHAGRCGGEPPEAHRLSLDSSKARGHLGWAPVWDGPDAVRQTASWYREYYRSPASARGLVDDQLRAYQGDAGAAGLTWAATEERGSTG